MRRLTPNFQNRTGDLVVIATGENPNFVRPHLINESMLLTNPPRPTSGQLVFQRLRLANAGKRIALRVSY